MQTKIQATRLQIARDYVRVCTEEFFKSLSERSAHGFGRRFYTRKQSGLSDFENAVLVSEQSIVQEGGYSQVFLCGSGPVDKYKMLPLYVGALENFCKPVPIFDKEKIMMMDVETFRKLNRRVSAGKGIAKCKLDENPKLKDLVSANEEQDKYAAVHSLICDAEQENRVRDAGLNYCIKIGLAQEYNKKHVLALLNGIIESTKRIETDYIIQFCAVTQIPTQKHKV